MLQLKSILSNVGFKSVLSKSSSIVGGPSSSSSSSTSNASKSAFSVKAGGFSSYGAVTLTAFITHVAPPDPNNTNKPPTRITAIPIFPFPKIAQSPTISMSEDRRKLVVVTHKSSNRTFYFELDRSFTVAVFGNFDPNARGWHIFEDVRFEASIVKGVVYDNVRCGHIKPWPEAPTSAQMFEVLEQIYTPDTLKLQSIDNIYFPLSVLENVKEEEEENEEAGGEELSDQQKDEKKQAAREERNKNWRIEQNKLLQSIYRQSPADDDVYALLHTGSRRNLFLVLKKDNPETVAKAIQNNAKRVVLLKSWEWDPEIFRTDKDGRRKENKNAKGPFKHISVYNVTIKAVIYDLEHCHKELLRVDVQVYSSHMSKLGIVRPEIQQALLVPKLNQIEFILQTHVEGMNTAMMKINTTAIESDKRGNPIKGISLSATNVYVNICKTIKTIGIEINLETAFNLLRKFIQVNKGVIRSRDTVSIQSIFQVPGADKTALDWINNNNTLATTTGNNIINMMETVFEWSPTMDGPDYDYFVLINAQVIGSIHDDVEKNSAELWQLIDKGVASETYDKPQNQELVFHVFAIKKGYQEPSSHFDLSPFLSSFVPATTPSSSSSSSLSSPLIESKPTPPLSSLHLEDDVPVSSSDINPEIDDQIDEDVDDDFGNEPVSKKRAQPFSFAPNSKKEPLKKKTSKSKK